ncbi:2'-5' RNA ligase family protein [Gordonia sp. ABSL11-1]|uniref:2'-5' RNA ligase family protein n=1 Tax=Gordonia sp. ABSL11-1 TaxID=3053924 RepID=UPI002573993A|nr:2'-5' RNA ligase family protein [Gordonia sp. ABSL11-1]MDL9948282.1 2'-5' RNA ligase family protein [Gordonia sp. ABSL11-1]
MVHSLELLLDEASDQQVRDEWDTLAAAGLPSQSAHRAPSNRPHITLAAAGHIAGSADAALVPVGMRLPIPVLLGAPILFGRPDHLTLARLVVPSTDLLSVHAQTLRLAADHLGDESGGGATPMPHSLAGRWTPHVTLARRLTPDELTRALAVLDTRGTIEGRAVGLRHWDGNAKTESMLAGRAC